MENSPLSLLDRFNHWMKESVMIKLTSIGFLVLILLIPNAWIESLIQERQNRAEDVIREVSDKWSGKQTIIGPVLMIPFTKIEKVKKWQEGVQVEEMFESEHQAFFLPEKLVATADMKPEVLHRGIFDAVVYHSKVDLVSKFGPLHFDQWGIPETQVHWKKASLIIGIQDLRGISDEPFIQSGLKDFSSEPSGDVGLAIRQPIPSTESYPDNTTSDAYPINKTEGIIANLGWSNSEDVTSDFNIKLSLKGSELLYFVPAGKTTDVTIRGEWAAPSFDGKILPSSRAVSEKDFKASWKLLSYNRPFAQQWLDREQSLGGAEFGVRLIIPADQYQKSIRTSKYGVLIIILAFTSLFLVEITSRIRIHPFQYILVGAALIIYYTLLLSFSEHVGYNVAYWIASVATVILLTLYSFTFLRSRSLTGLFSVLMSVFYLFIFIIIQAEDFSLLIGSLGLFAIVAMVMYFSRNINWYKETVHA
jgi:inner membrane protein